MEQGICVRHFSVSNPNSKFLCISAEGAVPQLVAPGIFGAVGLLAIFFPSQPQLLFVEAFPASHPRESSRIYNRIVQFTFDTAISNVQLISKSKLLLEPLHCKNQFLCWDLGVGTVIILEICMKLCSINLYVFLLLFIIIVVVIDCFSSKTGIRIVWAFLIKSSSFPSMDPSA